MDIAPVSATTTQTPAKASLQKTTGSEASFAATLDEASGDTAATTTDTTAATGQADLVSGRLGIDYKDMGVPYRVVYFDENGQTLTTSPFDAASILELSDKFGIDLNDLTGLGEQLDALDVGYRPYELYPGTGSDHGIDFADLIDGGLGTAYDWREDKNVALKGAGAQKDLEAARALAQDLNLERHDEVTTGGGIDPARLAPLATTAGAVFSHIVYTGETASWYATREQAASAATTLGGQVFDLASLVQNRFSSQTAALEATTAFARTI